MSLNNSIIERQLLDKIRRMQNLNLSKDDIDKAFNDEEKAIIKRTIAQSSELKETEKE